MQYWTLLDAARLAAEEAFRTDFLYDQPQTYLDTLAEAHTTLQDQFAAAPTERDYWTARNAAFEILYRTAMFQQDGDHGPDPDPPHNDNQPHALFLHQTGEHATTWEAQQMEYNHWDSYDEDLATWSAALAVQYAKPPAQRDRLQLLDALDTLATATTIFISRARFTRHDRDPHTRQNFAVHRWTGTEWETLADRCLPGFIPDPPTFDGNQRDERLCRPCLEYSYRSPAPRTEPRPAPAFRDALPYHALAIPTEEAGIITAATTEHWPMIGAMALTANLHRYPLAVADHGLSPDIRRALNRFHVRWVDHIKPPIPPAMPPHHAVAPPNAWWKPWVCLASPWERSIWIDADALPISDLDVALDPAYPTVLLTRNDRFSLQSFNLYRPIHAATFPDIPAPTRDNSQTICNTGVLAWTRGDVIIQQWIAAALPIIASPKLQTLANCRDQSAMYCALVDRKRYGMPNPPYLDLGWNWPADGYAAHHTQHRRPLPTDPDKLLAVVRRRHPTATIVHWLGTPKPNDLYQTSPRKA